MYPTNTDLVLPGGRHPRLRAATTTVSEARVAATRRAAPRESSKASPSHACRTDARGRPQTFEHSWTPSSRTPDLFSQVRDPLPWWWQIQDSNLGSSRDGFTD
jgi:hypothetical protein